MWITQLACGQRSYVGEVCAGASVLAAGKGWVLAMLAMLGPKPGLCVAARGSGPGAKRRRPCPPLRAAAAWRASGRRASRRIDAKRACRPGVEQKAWEGSKPGRGIPLLTPAAAWAANALGASYSGLSAFSASDYQPGDRQPSARRLRVRPGNGLGWRSAAVIACLPKELNARGMNLLQYVT